MLLETLDEISDAEVLRAWIHRLAEGLDLPPANVATIDKLASRLHDDWEEVDAEGERAIEEAQTEAFEDLEKSRVRVLTMRKAKGLDAQVVLVPDAEQPLIPGEHDVEEQRRLFYVSVTRAKQALHILHVSARRRSGRTRYAGSGYRKPDAYRPRTQFLNEMGVASN